MIPSILLSNIVMPLVERFSSSQCWSIYNELKNFQNESFSYRSKQQRQQITKLLMVASTKVEYWQQVFSDLNITSNDITPDNVLSILSLLPITHKCDYRKGFPDKVTVQGSKNNWQYLSSSGTSERMTVVTDFNKRDYLRAAEYLNLYFTLGKPVGQGGIDIPPNACNVVCGLSDASPEPIFEFIWSKTKDKALFSEEAVSDLRGRVERQIIMKRKTMLPIDVASWPDMQNQLDNYLDDILIAKAKVLRGLPQFLFWLAKRAQERELNFKHLKAILPYGGLACEEIVKVVTNAFSASYIDVYGTGEVGAIGCTITKENTIDVYQNLIYVEILGDNNLPVKLGEIGKIVVTDLRNLAMPIIRYEIGDVGMAISCEGENNQLSVIKVLGRTQEMYKNAQGNIISIRALQNLFYSFEHIVNFKVDEVINNKFKVVLVSKGDVDKADLSGKLMKLLGIKDKPLIKEVAFIMPEASGKYLAFKKKKDPLHG
jgi:phenylacetate-CoA ligase